MKVNHKLTIQTNYQLHVVSVIIGSKKKHKIHKPTCIYKDIV